MKSFSNLFKKNKTNDDSVVVLDIGSDTVKALIFKIDKKNKKGIVIGTGKSSHRAGDMRGSAVADLQGVISTCQETISEAKKMAGEIYPQQIVFGIAGELVKCFSTVINCERTSPKTKIDLKELKSIIQKAQREMFDSAISEISQETEYKKTDVELINADIANVKIDGYSIGNPLGFQGKDISFNLFNAYAPLIYLKAFQQIALSLKLDILLIAAEPYAIASSFDKKQEEDFSALFIDIGGTATNIAIVKSGAIEGISNFAFGGRIFTKRISKELNLNFKNAEKKKIEYSNKKLSLDESCEISAILKEDCQVWIYGVKLTLEEFSKIKLLPTEIFLCGETSNLPEIQKILKMPAWRKSFPFAKKPAVNFIKPQDISNILDKTGTLKNSQDITSMSLASFVLNLSCEEKFLQGILKEIIKTE